MLYDRNDRSIGTAFITYYEEADADQAIRDYDGANAMGQEIRVKLAPREDRQPRQPVSRPRDLIDRIEKPVRSLMDRMSGNDDRGSRQPRRDDRDRSRSPVGRRRDDDRRRRRSASPLRRDDRTDRERRGGRGGRGGGRGGRRERATNSGTNGRARKTAEELDAEMNDYWEGNNAAPTGPATGPNPASVSGQVGAGHTTVSQGATAGSTTAPVNADDDLDLMVE